MRWRHHSLHYAAWQAVFAPLLQLLLLLPALFTISRCPAIPTPHLPPAANGRTILFITERAVFRLAQQQGGGGSGGGPALELIEVAPGIDVGARGGWMLYWAGLGTRLPGASTAAAPKVAPPAAPPHPFHQPCPSLQSEMC